MLSNAQLGFILSIGAGAATGLGAATVLSKRLVELASKRTLAIALALAGGVMVFISFVDIFVKAREAFESPLGPEDAHLAATACFFAGVLLVFVINNFTHSCLEKPSRRNILRTVEEQQRPDLTTNDIEATPPAEEESEPAERPAGVVVVDVDNNNDEVNDPRSPAFPDPFDHKITKSIRFKDTSLVEVGLKTALAMNLSASNVALRCVCVASFCVLLPFVCCFFVCVLCALCVCVEKKQRPTTLVFL